ncbi:hypothetical protein QFC19_008577 [Naganishia cerealis]|uniref:Uncharacterized protein n=1 Tax=Naganishia cerealis TaxID=610337 RepID=A0ACC2V192_9TREE|nr:hypothetical protein QFC19_008577 [Naganishia cerealis]
MADTELFRDAAFRVSVPTCPDGLQLPAGDDDDAVRRWLATLESQNERSCCFYDETLFYLCQLTYRTEASSDAAVRSAFERVCNAVKITTQCSFLPRSVPDPQQRRRSSGPSMHPDRLSSAGSTVTLGASKDTIQNLGLPPDTPNPMPGTQAGYAQYAQAAGVQVWEGGLMPVLASNDDDLRSGSTAAAAASGSETRCVVLKSDEALVAYWIGRVPLAFANVDMRDPLLAVTCHVTLRGSKAAEVDDMNVARSNKGGVGDGEETVTVSSIVGMQDALAGLGGGTFTGPKPANLICG